MPAVSVLRRQTSIASRRVSRPVFLDFSGRLQHNNAANCGNGPQLGSQHFLKGSIIHMSEHNKGRLYILSTALLWGLAGVCVKILTWSSLSIMAVRSLVSLIMLLIGKRSFSLHLSKINILGGLMMVLTGTLYMQSIKMTTAGTAIVLQYIAPILVYLFSVITGKRRMRLAEALIVLAVFGGCVLSFSDNLDPTHLVGNLFGLASCVTYAAQIICMGREDSESDDCTMIGNIMAVIICAPFMFMDKGLTFTGSNILWISIMSVFQYGMANIMFVKGIDRIDDVEASLILTVEPVFNPIPVAIIYGEMMGPRAILGSAIVIIFIAVYSALPSIEARLREKKKPSPGE